MFDWILGLIRQGGYLGIAFLMFAENVFPPIPSEVIMPLAGFIAAQGDLGIVMVVLAGSAGALLGALGWYYVEHWLGYERLERFVARHGRWLTLGPRDLAAARDWFRTHGGKAVFFGRLVPGVRTLISVPAGVSGMKLLPFLAWTSLGTAIWTALLAMAGYVLQSQYHRIADGVDVFAQAVLILVVGIYLYRVVTWSPER